MTKKEPRAAHASRRVAWPHRAFLPLAGHSERGVGCHLRRAAHEPLASPGSPRGPATLHEPAAVGVAGGRDEGPKGGLGERREQAAEDGDGQRHVRDGEQLPRVRQRIDVAVPESGQHGEERDAPEEEGLSVVESLLIIFALKNTHVIF